MLAALFDRANSMQRTPNGLARSLLLVVVSCVITPWADAPRANAPPAIGSTADSLYARMGGTRNVTAVVSDLIDEAASDPQLKRSFDKVNLGRLKRLLVEQICELTGGGCRYSGDAMRDVHAGLGITQAEFYGLVQVLKDAMQRHGIAIRERNELLAILAPMKRDIVER
jgi:hemoglobin